jgi:hypothetical protein
MQSSIALVKSEDHCGVQAALDLIKDDIEYLSFTSRR